MKETKCPLSRGISQSEKATLLYDFNSMTFRKRQNYGDRKKISGGQRLGERRDRLAKHRGFLRQ